MILLKVYYTLAWVLLLSYWAIDSSIWLTGVGVGLLFHMVICSIILHKYFTHKTFKINRYMHFLFSYLGTLNLNGSVVAWANMHRLHHATSDREGDPHDPETIGVLKSLFVFSVKDYTRNTALTSNLKKCKDLLSDKHLVFFHKYLAEVVSATYFVVGILSLKFLVILLIATGVSFIGLFFTTYVYHKPIPLLQYRNHNTKDKSYNNRITAILFPGEAYHNNHHNNPSKFETGERWFEFDLTAVIINLIKIKG